MFLGQTYWCVFRPRIELGKTRILGGKLVQASFCCSTAAYGTQRWRGRCVSNRTVNRTRRKDFANLTRWLTDPNRAIPPRRSLRAYAMDLAIAGIPRK